MNPSQSGDGWNTSAATELAEETLSSSQQERIREFYAEDYAVLSSCPLALNPGSCLLEADLPE